MKRKPNGYWTFEKCKEEALKYYTKKEFHHKSGSAYDSACTHGWLDEIQSHLKGNRKPNNYWTKEKCKEEALKYETRNEFQRNSRSAYTASRRNFWIDEICIHMREKGTLRKRYIYSFEFDDNYVYVGLTYNIEIRKNLHMGLNKALTQSEKSQVYCHMKKTGLIPNLFILTKEPIDENSAAEIERLYIKYYKDNKWILLNKIVGGGLGYGAKKWTKEKIKEEALKYKSRYEFKKKSVGAYNAAVKLRIMNDVCLHMNTKPITHWTKELAHEEALKYDNTTDFLKYSLKAYSAARKYGWLNEIRTHMKIIK